MRQFLVIISIFLIFICIVYTLPTTTKAPEVYNCSPKEAEEFEKNIAEFEISFFLSLILRKLIMISTTCKQFINTTSNSSCKLVNREKEMDLKNACAKMIYAVDEFTDCAKILEKDNSTCYNTMKDITLKEKRETNMTDIYYCNNVLGEGNCMRKLIIEKCGEKQWQGYKTAYSTADPFCDFSQL
ncbi:unnamed protein product [Caenorhabditis angaria]|uniref:T20D4.11-like domain-containing protein n=1 Tax=Caenorhabditis angaria TaxID=860376 RepID=A0A9P1J2L6_9PELO|nr:unnamed protein product [Caenorhabditis angaria]